MTFTFFMKKRKHADLWDEAGAFRPFFFLPFLPFYFLLIPEFVSRLDWQSEGFQKRAAVDFMYHRLTLSDQKPQRLEGQVWPD